MKFKRSDVVSLSKAVSRFNKLVNEIENKTDYTPKLQNYKELKENILTRKEFNKVLRSLKSANKENLTKSRQLGHLTLSEYEYQNIKRNQRNAIASLNYKINKYKENLFQINRRTGYFKDKEQGLRTTLNSIRSLDKKSPEDLENTLKRIEYNSNSKDYRSAINFKKFYETYVMPELEGYDGYDKLKVRLDRTKSPKEYYKIISSSPTLIDLVQWYDKTGSTTFVDVKASLAGYGMEQQDAFTYAVESELGLE